MTLRPALVGGRASFVDEDIDKCHKVEKWKVSAKVKLARIFATLVKTARANMKLIQTRPIVLSTYFSTFHLPLFTYGSGRSRMRAGLFADVPVLDIPAQPADHPSDA